MTLLTPAQQVEAFVESLFGNIATTTGATSTRQVTRHFAIAASGSSQFKTAKDEWLRKCSSSSAQYSVSLNGMTYTQIQNITAPAQIFGNQILVYNPAGQGGQLDGINVFIPAGSTVTVSVSSSSSQILVLYFDQST